MISCIHGPKFVLSENYVQLVKSAIVSKYEHIFKKNAIKKNGEYQQNKQV